MGMALSFIASSKLNISRVSPPLSLSLRMIFLTKIPSLGYDAEESVHEMKVIDGNISIPVDFVEKFIAMSTNP